MQLRIGNIIAVLLLILFGRLTMRYRKPLGIAFESIALIGPGHDHEDQMIGAIILAFLCLTLVALVKILVFENRK